MLAKPTFFTSIQKNLDQASNTIVELTNTIYGRHKLDVVSPTKHDVIAIRPIDVEVDLSNVRRPTSCSLFHRLQQSSYQL